MRYIINTTNNGKVVATYNKSLKVWDLYTHDKDEVCGNYIGELEGITNSNATPQELLEAYNKGFNQK